MATATEPVRGFALSDLPDLDAPGGPAPGAPAEGAEDPTPTPEPAGNGGAADGPELELVDDTKKDAPKGKPEDVEEAENLNAAMDRAASAGKKEADEKKEADAKAAEEKAAVDKAAAEQKPEPVVPPEKLRDADLTEELSPHLHPKTKTVINNYRGLAKVARDERDALAKEREELRQKLAATEEQVKKAAVPKHIEEEVKTLRERVRELDITKDPELETKYDKRIKANDDNIVSVLKAQGFGMVKGEGDKFVEDPKAITALVKGGLNFANLQPLLKKLDEAGLVEEAQEIRDSLTENRRLSKEKQGEIEQWKSGYDQRIQQREHATKQQREQRENSFREQTERQFRADMAELVKEFTFLNRPPDPLPTDAPAVAKAKQAAIDEFNAADLKIKEGVKAFDTNVPPEKQAEVVGRLNAAAIQALVLKTQVVPRLRRDVASSAARIKQLEAELGALRGAGKLSRAMGNAPSNEPANNGRPEPVSLEDALGSGPGR